MADRPILFSGAMVRALLGGTKTQTRRLATNSAAGRIQVWDRLWVRENYAYVGTSDPGILVYAATYPAEAQAAGCDNIPATLKEAGYSWTPSIHMPRKVSRLTLTVTEVRRHRLHEISEADAQAEGCVKLKASGRAVEEQGAQHFGAVWPSCRMWFADLWDSINGPGSWDANPDIIAVTFAVERRNIDG